MKSPNVIRTVVLILACLTLVDAAEARTWGQSNNTKPPYVLIGYYGVASYAMDDMNSTFETANDEAGAPVIDPIEGGTEFGFRLLVPINWELSLGFNYTAMMASTGVGTLPGSSDYLEIDTRGSSFEISLDYRMEFQEKYGLGLGVALSRFKADGHKLGSYNGEYFEYEYRGDGWGPVVRLNGDMNLSRSISLWLEGGYRDAETGTVEHNGYDWYTDEGQPMSFSYTGFFARLGLRMTSRLID